MIMTVNLFIAEFVIVSYVNNNYMTYCTSYYRYIIIYRNGALYLTTVTSSHIKNLWFISDFSFLLTRIFFVFTCIIYLLVFSASPNAPPEIH